MKSNSSTSSVEDNLEENLASSQSLINSQGMKDRQNMEASSQNNLSSNSEDNNHQQKDNLLNSTQPNKSKSKAKPHSLDTSTQQCLPMIRSSRKIKKDYKNLSLVSKYEMQDQNEIQNSASKKKKVINSSTKSKKKRQDQESNLGSNQQTGVQQQQQQHSRSQHSSSSQSQANPYIRLFKNTVLESLQKCKSQLPPKMLSFLQKQSQINLNTVSKINIRLPKEEEYSESINNIQQVLSEQETIIKDLVGAQSNQSLFDFLNKQRHSKKELQYRLQYLERQKQEQINKSNIEQLKQNLQYKINPQFIKSELKKELKTLKQSSNHQSHSGKDSPQSFTKHSFTSHINNSKECNQRATSEMEAENMEENLLIKESEAIQNQQDNYEQASDICEEIPSNNNHLDQQAHHLPKQEFKRKSSSQIQKKKQSHDQHDASQEVGNKTAENKESTSANFLEEQSQNAKKQTSSTFNTATSTPTASQINNNRPNQNQLPQQINQKANPHNQFQYGNLPYHRYPMKQQIFYPNQPHPEGYYMYYPAAAAGYPYQNQHPHPHYNQRFWDRSAIQANKPYQKVPYQNYENQIGLTQNTNVNSNNNNTVNNECNSTEQTTSSLYLSGDNQENIYHSSLSTNAHHPHFQSLCPNMGLTHQYSQEYQSQYKRDSQVLHNSLRINRNNSVPANFYQPNYTQQNNNNNIPSQPYPIPDYQNNLGANFSTEGNDQANNGIDTYSNQNPGYYCAYNNNEKEQLNCNLSQRDEFFNDLDDAIEDSLSNFNIKTCFGSKKKKDLFDNDLDMEMQDRFNQNLTDFN
ncbi:hypothetical protein ABPG74_004471 [Tetrahymena malaccensis]